MTENEKDDATELRKVQLDRARIELKLKERELQQKPRWWIQILSSSAFAAALVTAIVTIGFDWYSSEQAKRDSDKSILLGVIGQNNPYAIASKLRVFLDAGIIYDKARFGNAVRSLEDQLTQQIIRNILNASRDLPLDFGSTVAKPESLLKPLDLPTLEYFIRQDYPRNLLFQLFVDSVTVAEPGQTNGYRYAPPNNYGCNASDSKNRCLIDWMQLANLGGLTVEEKNFQNPTGASTGATTTTFSRFCFDPILAQDAQSSIAPAALATAISNIGLDFTTLSHSSPLACGSEAWTPQASSGMAQPDMPPLLIKFNDTVIVITMVPRSLHRVFDYLGLLLKVQSQNLKPSNTEYLSNDRPDVLEPPITVAIVPTPKNAEDCFVTTEYEKQSYCVPGNASTMKKIFAILADLLRLS
jgi:hypothetical protein